VIFVQHPIERKDQMEQSEAEDKKFKIELDAFGILQCVE
jgi:hypothetical protein